MHTKRCYIGKSLIPNAGLGLFTGEKILKGEVVWENYPASEIVYSPQERDALPSKLKENIRKYVYKCEGNYHLNLDDSRHYNHSDTPNTFQLEDGNFIATQDIEKDTELTTDYSSFYDEEWENEILKQ